MMSNGLKIDIPISKSHHVKGNLQSLKKILSIDSGKLSVVNGVDIFKTNRSVESLPKNFKSVVCTTYFSSKKDPQRELKIDSNDISYIAPWYNSMLKLKLEGIVFYDHLSSDFIEKYKTDHISFVKCQLGNYSLNDERFIIYYMFFLKHKAEQILLTDGNDVVINKPDLFNFFTTKTNSTLFIGRGKENRIYQSKWNMMLVDKFEKGLETKLPNNFFNMAVYNAGIVGGSQVTMLYFLRQISSILLKIDNDNNNNMTAMHYVVYHFFYPKCRKGLLGVLNNTIDRDIKIRVARKLKKWNLSFLVDDDIKYHEDKAAISNHIFSGYPLNSKFTHFETNSNACIIHK